MGGYSKLSGLKELLINSKTIRQKHKRSLKNIMEESSLYIQDINQVILDYTLQDPLFQKRLDDLPAQVKQLNALTKAAAGTLRSLKLKLTTMSEIHDSLCKQNMTIFEMAPELSDNICDTYQDQKSLDSLMATITKISDEIDQLYFDLFRSMKRPALTPKPNNLLLAAYNNTQQPSLADLSIEDNIRHQIDPQSVKFMVEIHPMNPKLSPIESPSNEDSKMPELRI